MTKRLETADTLPMSFPPRSNGRLAKGAAAGLSGVGVAGAVIYYLLTCISAHGDRLQVVESKVGTVTETIGDVREGQREVLDKIDVLNRNVTVEVGALNAKVGRIEGYIAAQRDNR